MKKTYILPCTIVADVNVENMLAASAPIGDTPQISGTDSEGGEGLAKENWGDIWE